MHADANGIGLGRNTCVADVDIVIARGEIVPRARTQCDIARAGGVVKERINTVGRVVAAGCVAKERTNTGGCVGDAGDVVNERVLTQERVDVGGVAALLTNCSRLRRKRKADEHK